MHRRNAIRWVRTVTPDLIVMLNGPTEQRTVVLTHALQASRLGWAVGMGAPAPWTEKAIPMLLKPPAQGAPIEIGNPGVDSTERKLITGIHQSATQAVAFLHSEVVVPQGASTGLQFLDAAALMNALSLLKDCNGQLPAAELDEATWWGRSYRKALDDFAQVDVEKLAAARHDVLQSHVSHAVVSCLQECGREGLPSRNALEELHGVVRQLLEEETKHFGLLFSDRQFLASGVADSPEARALRKVVEQVMAALAKDSARNQLARAEALLAVNGVLAGHAARLHRTIVSYCRQLDQSLTANEESASDGDPVRLRQEVREQLVGLTARLVPRREEAP